MDTLLKLSKLLAGYRVYPNKLYNQSSPVKVFQYMYPDNHYSVQIEEFLKQHDYEPVRRGADLPWWGKEFFSGSQGFRTFIISQDSLSADAGSIVLFANLFTVCDGREVYEWYHGCLGNDQSFRYASWRKIKDLFVSWNLDFNYMYVTDAAKVYKSGSWKDRDFDKRSSQELLEQELKICKPDLVIILGSSGVSLLLQGLKYSDIVERGTPISTSGFKCIVVPFPIGNGPVQRNFAKRLHQATEQILLASQRG